MRQNTIALVYDFDGTLTPKTMQEYTIIPRLKLNSNKFWADILNEANATDGEIMMIYMRQLISHAESLGIKITKDEFTFMADKIKYFRGVKDWFKNINDYIKKNHKNIKVSHYVISAGHHEILQATSIRKNLTNIFGSQYYFDKHGNATFPKIVVTDTTKTQFLFRINKGKEKFSESINPNTLEPYGLINVELLQPEKILEIETNFLNTTCSESNDGEIEIFISGGKAPYNITWNTDISFSIVESDAEKGYLKL